MNFYNIKEDWREVKKRWEAWWDFDMYDRPLILVTAPKNNPKLPPELENFGYEETDFERKWTDIDYIKDKMLYEFYHTYYGGESVPALKYGGSVGHALTFGCEPIYVDNSIWARKLPVKEGCEYPELYFDENNYWWRKLRDTVEKTALASKQRFFSSAMLGNHAGDNLSICRGTEELLYDLIENPKWVKNSVKYISDSMIKQFEALYKLTPLTGLEGYVNYVDCWSPKKTHGFDTDFSYMISPEDFRNIFLPPLIETMSIAEHRIYHLDGIMAMKNHLDTLLELDELHAFQWAAGDGHWEPMQWVPLLRKMQAHKKSVLCYAPANAVIPLIKELRGEGLCIWTFAGNEDEAKQLIDNVERVYK